MKTIYTLFGLLFCISGYSQINHNLQTKYCLSAHEAEMLNSIFLKKRKDFDFSKKNVAFTVGIRGTHIENKDSFFEQYLNPVIEGKNRNVCSFILLTETEKTNCEFDVVVMSPYKVFTRKDRERLIKGLSAIEKSCE